MDPRDRTERGFFFMADEPPPGGGTDPGTAPPAPGTDPPAKEPTEVEKLQARLAQLEKDKQSEVDRYRNEAGQAAKKLKQIEDANKSETERLQERAKAADELEPKVETLEKQVQALTEALGAEVDRQKKALQELDKDMLELLPDGDPVSQLAWVSKALAKASKDRKQSLPPGGGRNPGGDRNGKTEPTEEERQKAAAHYATRF